MRSDHARREPTPQRSTPGLHLEDLGSVVIEPEQAVAGARYIRRRCPDDAAVMLAYLFDVEVVG